MLGSVSGWTWKEYRFSLCMVWLVLRLTDPACSGVDGGVHGSVFFFFILLYFIVLGSAWFGQYPGISARQEIA